MFALLIQCIYLKEIWHMKLWQGHFTKMMDNLLRPAHSELFASKHRRKLSLEIKLFNPLLFLQVLCETHSSSHEQTIHHLLSNMDVGLFYRQMHLGVYLKYEIKIVKRTEISTSWAPFGAWHWNGNTILFNLRSTPSHFSTKIMIWYFDWHFIKFSGLIPFISLVYLNIRILISLRNLRSRLNTRCQETQGCNPVKGKVIKNAFIV